MSPALAGGIFTREPSRKPSKYIEPAIISYSCYTLDKYVQSKNALILTSSYLCCIQAFEKVGAKGKETNIYHTFKCVLGFPGGLDG